jgi:hypothetical protein
VRLLLRALTTAEAPREAPPGLVGVHEAGIIAWATGVAEPAPRFGRDDLLEQHQLISRLHAQFEACLPARFPSWFADEHALRAEIRGRQAEFRTALDAVQGRCELAVTVLWDNPVDPVVPTEASAPGTRYLRERQQALVGSDRRRARARELADEIEHVAGADVVAVRRQVCPSAAVAVSAALLAPRGCADELIARLPRARDGVRILVNGPWPPYTFADTGADAGRQGA